MEQGKLRIVGGEYGGRVLRFPLVSGLRPTSGMVRAAMFSALQSRCDLQGARALDLFAGVGGLGFEALSRGVASVTFVERHSKLVQGLRENAKLLACQNQVEVIGADVEQWLEEIKKGVVTPEKFDLIFADPPYEVGFSERLPLLLLQTEILKPGGFFIFECGKRERLGDLRTAEFEFVPKYEKVAGDTQVFLFKHNHSPENSEHKGAQ